MNSLRTIIGTAIAGIFVMCVWGAFAKATVSAVAGLPALSSSAQRGGPIILSELSTIHKVQPGSIWLWELAFAEQCATYLWPVPPHH